MPPKKKNTEVYRVELTIELRKRERNTNDIRYIGVLEPEEVAKVTKALKKKPTIASNVYVAHDEFLTYYVIYTIPKKDTITAENIKTDILGSFTEYIGLIEEDDKTIFPFIHKAIITLNNKEVEYYEPNHPLEKYEIKEEAKEEMPPKRSGTVILEVDIIEVSEHHKDALPLYKPLSKKLSASEIAKIEKVLGSKTNAAKSVTVKHNKKGDTFELTYDIEAHPGSTFSELKNLLFEIIGDVRIGWHDVKGDSRTLGYIYREKGTQKISLDQINKERQEFNQMRSNYRVEEQLKKTNKTVSPMKKKTTASPKDKTVYKPASPVKEMPPKKKSSPAKSSPAKKKGRGRPKKQVARTTPKKNQKVAKTSPKKTSPKKSSPTKSPGHKFAKVSLHVYQKKGGKRVTKKQLETLFDKIGSPIKIGKNEVFVHKTKVSKDGSLTVKFMIHDKVTPEKVAEKLREIVHTGSKFEVRDFKVTQLGNKNSNKGKTLSAIKSGSPTRSRSSTRSRSKSVSPTRSRSGSRTRSRSRSASKSATRSRSASVSPAKKGRGRPKKTSPAKKGKGRPKKSSPAKTSAKKRSPATEKLLSMLDEVRELTKDKTLQRMDYKVVGNGKKNLSKAEKDNIIEAVTEISEEPETKIGHITDNFVFADSIVLFNKTAAKNAEKFAKNIESSFNKKGLQNDAGKKLTLKRI